MPASATSNTALAFVDEQAPDATTLLTFRHLLEKHGIAKVFFHAFASTLAKCGYIMRGGTIVDATLIHPGRQATAGLRIRTLFFGKGTQNEENRRNFSSNAATLTVFYCPAE
ncbi:MAG: hypothetical protein LBD42_08555 [Desulfovibrio sp.]|jgi:IS5 family transposase|nr:hypothetical protein [Desulfovibrio sp.]